MQIAAVFKQSKNRTIECNSRNDLQEIIVYLQKSLGVVFFSNKIIITINDKLKKTITAIKQYAVKQTLNCLYVCAIKLTN